MKVAAYCPKCQINWANLSSQSDEMGDETYYFCPECKADENHLLEAKQAEAFIKSPFSGEIISTLTGKELTRYKVLKLQKNWQLCVTPYIRPVIFQRPSQLFDGVQWLAEKFKQQELEDAAINEYRAAIDAGCTQQEAERAYLTHSRSSVLIASYQSDLQTTIIQQA